MKELILPEMGVTSFCCRLRTGKWAGASVPHSAIYSKLVKLDNMDDIKINQWYGVQLHAMLVVV